MSEAAPFLSVVIPVYNEAENLRPLHRRLTEVCGALNRPYEIIFCDDGSTDTSQQIIRSLAREDTAVRAVWLSRNFGHQVCLTAGLDHARGEVTVMMDADLQDPPELIPQMLAKYEEGFDVVYAVRTRRDGESAFKRATAAVWYRVLRFCTRIDIPNDVGDFRLISRPALESVLAVRENNRYLRGLFTWVGFRQTGVPYSRAPRHSGRTKFPLRKMLRFAADGITSFSAIPLQFSMWLGFAGALVGVLYGVNVFLQGLRGDTVPGWASLAILVIFFGSVQLITIGIVGEYLSRIFEEVKKRPLYFVRERLGFEERSEQTQAPGEPVPEADAKAEKEPAAR